jgi:hypothetical protein
VRVIDDVKYLKGKYNPQEGGPKGVELVAGDVVVVTTTEQTLAFFDLADFTAAEDLILVNGPPATGTKSVAVRRTFDHLQRRLDAAEAELARLQAEGAAQLGEFAAQMELLQAQQEKDRAALGRADQRAGELEARVVRARSAFDDAERRIAALEAELAAVRASTSWRLTSPLRSVADRVKH